MAAGNGDRTAWDTAPGAALKKAALERRDALAAERQALREEKERLTQLVARLRRTAQDKMLKKHAENLMMQADNDELKQLAERARRLRELQNKIRAKKMAPPGALSEETGYTMEDVAKEKAELTSQLTELLPRPVRTLPGAAIASPAPTGTPTLISPRLQRALDDDRDLSKRSSKESAYFSCYDSRTTSNRTTSKNAY